MILRELERATFPASSSPFFAPWLRHLREKLPFTRPDGVSIRMLTGRTKLLKYIRGCGMDLNHRALRYEPDSSVVNPVDSAVLTSRS